MPFPGRTPFICVFFFFWKLFSQPNVFFYHGVLSVNPGGRQQESHGQVAVDSAAGTTKCKTSSHFAKPVVQYALMVDAGSQGSRIHTYRFNNCGNAPELEKEGFWNIEPGLSSYKEDSEGAAKSLDVLLDAAVKEVPESLRSCTPIAVKATAGLRMLGEEMAQKILDAVRHRLETKYPFAVVPGDGVQIMDGRDEGRKYQE